MSRLLICCMEILFLTWLPLFLACTFAFPSTPYLLCCNKIWFIDFIKSLVVFTLVGLWFIHFLLSLVTFRQPMPLHNPMVYSFPSFFGHFPTANALAIVRCFSLPIDAILDVRNTVAWPHTELGYVELLLPILPCLGSKLPTITDPPKLFSIVRLFAGHHHLFPWRIFSLFLSLSMRTLWTTSCTQLLHL
jgi:hypothetical protein